MKNQLLLLVATVLTFAINIVVYNQLPDKVGLQVSLSGDMNNQVPKMYFFWIAPMILLLYYLVSRNENNLRKSIFVTAIVFIVNLVIIYFNSY